MAGEMIRGLAEAGATVELFLEDAGSDLVAALTTHPNVSAVPQLNNWRFDRWYSASPFTKLLTGTAARARAQHYIAQSLLRRNAEAPFAVVYRLSQIELFGIRRIAHRLPPLLAHPEVHAEGERTFHWRERSFVRSTETPALFAANHSYLVFRSHVQRRDVHVPDRVVVPSSLFAHHLQRDYGLPEASSRVVPNIINLDRFAPALDAPPLPPLRLLFVSRMSVRKGVELVVALTHRLDDLAGRVEIICIGGHSLFSDYRGLLENLNPRTGSYVGELASSEVPGMYQGAHGVIQPSWYEPFGNTVAEALATGLPVVVSNEVGAGENAPPSVCRTHPIGDLDAMERAVRGLIADLEAGGGTKFAVTARQYAAARFGRDNYADTMLALIEELTGPYADRIRLPAT